MRKDERIILHFDYDCFYASVFEAKNPALRSLPFAVQQKQIIVTCNYTARARGLHKLQLVREAKRICPDVIIELGEDISRFRDASKELYGFLKAFSWSSKVERLGFDEVWMDVTDVVDYNIDVLNPHSLASSFFQTSREDPTQGFAFDASKIAGHTYPKDCHASLGAQGDDEALLQRLILGSHYAQHVRHALELQKGYTCTVGISTSKLLSKLVGNLHKPKGQTTILPPYNATAAAFIDAHDIGKIPGIGFKLSQKLREHILRRPAPFDAGLVYGGTKEKIAVADVRSDPDVNPEMLEKLLAGPGSPHGIGWKVWCLLHGVDDTEVGLAKSVPSQISIEDSYIRLDTMPELVKELTTLSRSLLSRMRIDLCSTVDDSDGEYDSPAPKTWLAYPKTLRLTTRPRQPLQPDGTRVRSFKRISHSAPLPNFVFGLHDAVDDLAERLVRESLLNMFRKLHPEKGGWNLSLVNLAVTNMAEAAGDSRTAKGRDVGTMFKRQDEVLKDFRIIDEVEESTAVPELVHEDEAEDWDESGIDSGDMHGSGQDDWGEPKDALADGDAADDRCIVCGMRLPPFAMGAHMRFHDTGVGGSCFMHVVTIL